MGKIRCLHYCAFFQYDFVELLDGSRLISKDKRALSDTDAAHIRLAGSFEEESEGGPRHIRSVNVHEAGFIQYLDTGIWHLAFYNDGRNTEQVSYNTIIIGETCFFFLGRCCKSECTSSKHVLNVCATSLLLQKFKSTTTVNNNNNNYSEKHQSRFWSSWLSGT